MTNGRKPDCCTSAMFALLSVLTCDQCKKASLLCKPRLRSGCFCMSAIDARKLECYAIAMFPLLSVVACDRCKRASLLCKLRLGLVVSVCNGRKPDCCVITMFPLLSVFTCDQCKKAGLCKPRLRSRCVCLSAIDARKRCDFRCLAVSPSLAA